MFDMITFDADDTLWHDELNYKISEDDLCMLLGAFADKNSVKDYLISREKVNLPLYGYGFKRFTISMIETAIDLSGGEIKSRDIKKIIGFTRRMVEFEVVLLKDVENVLKGLYGKLPLAVITKGDLLDQDMKYKRSGLDKYFDHFEIVKEKNSQAYDRLFSNFQVDPHKVLMVGNSLRSDILPVLELGGYAVHIPYAITWEFEKADQNPYQDSERFFELKGIGELPALLRKLNGVRV